MATQSVPSNASSTVSQKKLDANRRNAQKSTGPKTIEGKAAVAQNAIKHGLASAFCPILPGEDPEEFNAYRSAMMRDVKPRGILQTEFTDDLVIVRWKLKRISKIEAEMVESQQRTLMKEYEEKVGYEQLHRAPRVLPVPNIDPIHILAGSLPWNEKSSFALMDLYRERLLRAQYAVLRELRKLRAETGEGEGEEGSAQDLGLRTEEMQSVAANEQSHRDTGLRPVRNDVHAEEAVIANESSAHGPEAHVTAEPLDHGGTNKATADSKSLAGQEKRLDGDALGRAIDGALPQIARLDRMMEKLAAMEAYEPGAAKKCS